MEIGDKETESKQRGRQGQTFHHKVKSICQIYRSSAYQNKEVDGKIVFGRVKSLSE